MYVDSSAQESGSEQIASPAGQMELEFEDMASASGKSNGLKGRHVPSETEHAAKGLKNIDKPRRRIIEIKVYYDDLTYESFVPEKK